MSSEIEYTVRVVNAAAETIEHEMNKAELSAMVHRHAQTCIHLGEAVDTIESVIKFIDKSKVGRAIAVKSALVQVWTQVEKINKLVEDGYWVEMCSRLKRKRKIDSIDDQPKDFLPKKKYIGLFT